MIGEIFDLQESTGKDALLTKLLAQYYGELPFNGGDSFSDIPVVVKPDYEAQMERLCQVLTRALERIIPAYFTDHRIRGIYNLDAGLESILQMAEKQPYNVGLYRPDLLQAVDGQARICEIGARYPINGWMITYYLNLICSNQEVMPYKELQAVPGQLDFLEALYNTFTAAEPVVMVHEEEKGTEIYNLLNEFRKKGLNSVSASPADFKLDNGKVVLNGVPVSQFILEMDREELRKFSPDVIQQIILNGNYLNDVRTLILVHDKRVLAALYDENIMADYLTAEDNAFLRPFLIPTFTLSNAERRKEVIASDNNWLLKQNSGGRGIGIYVKDECTPQTWADVINEQWPEYMVQQYIPQQQFNYKGNPETDPINLVGMLLCYNNHSFGPGLFRGSTGYVVNAHGGRAVIFPPMVLRS